MSDSHDGVRQAPNGSSRDLGGQSGALYSYLVQDARQLVMERGPWMRGEDAFRWAVAHQSRLMIGPELAPDVDVIVHMRRVMRDAFVPTPSFGAAWVPCVPEWCLKNVRCALDWCLSTGQPAKDKHSRAVVARVVSPYGAHLATSAIIGELTADANLIGTARREVVVRTVETDEWSKAVVFAKDGSWLIECGPIGIDALLAEDEPEISGAPLLRFRR